jgi:hypothetical protein
MINYKKKLNYNVSLKENIYKKFTFKLVKFSNLESPLPSIAAPLSPI